MFEKLKIAWVVVFILWVGSQFIVSGETCDPGLWARFTGCPVAGIVSVATVSEPRGDDGVDYVPVPNGRGGDFEEVPTYEAARATLNVVAASVNVAELPRLPTQAVKLHPWCEYDGVVDFKTRDGSSLVEAAGIGESGLVKHANSSAVLRVPLTEPKAGDLVYAYCEAEYPGWFSDLYWECTYVCTHQTPRSWRRFHPQPAGLLVPATESCRIKGNISSKGVKIFHPPHCSHWSRTRISTSKGEQYFCSGPEAIEAGWRECR